MNIRVCALVNDSVVDGPGLRYAVFTQGCAHSCAGCHNPQSHDPREGFDVSADDILREIKKNPLLDGLTVSGGEPLDQLDAVTELVTLAKAQGLNVMLYTGYLWESFASETKYAPLLQNLDLCADGPFIEEKRDLDLVFLGSSNQRLIDVKKSLLQNGVVLYS